MIPQEDGIVVSATEPIKNRRRIWLRKGKNLFNEKNSTNGWINSSGQTEESIATKRTGKIKIKANENYIFSYEYTSLVSQDNRSYCLYNSDFEVISNSGITYNPTLKQLNINSTVDGYVDIGYDVNCTDIMFEQASSKTSYEEYIDPEVFIKNTNGDYEEFLTKDIFYQRDLSSMKSSIVTNVTRAIEMVYGRVHFLNIAVSVNAATDAPSTILETDIIPRFVTELYASNGSRTYRCILNTDGKIILTNPNITGPTFLMITGVFML